MMDETAGLPVGVSCKRLAERAIHGEIGEG